MWYFLDYESVKDNFIKYKSLSCNEDYSNKLDEELKKKFKDPFKFSNNDINKIILLLWKGVYPYDYMDDWEKFIETTLPEKEEFYNNLNMEEITDVDYMHGISQLDRSKLFSAPVIFTKILQRILKQDLEINRPSPIGENKKVIGLMKDEWGGKIVKKFVGLRAKTNSYLKDNDDEYKKAKETKKSAS